MGGKHGIVLTTLENNAINHLFGFVQIASPVTDFFIQPDDLVIRSCCVIFLPFSEMVPMKNIENIAFENPAFLSFRTWQHLKNPSITLYVPPKYVYPNKHSYECYPPVIKHGLPKWLPRNLHVSKMSRASHDDYPTNSSEPWVLGAAVKVTNNKLTMVIKCCKHVVNTYKLVINIHLKLQDMNTEKSWRSVELAPGFIYNYL